MLVIAVVFLVLLGASVRGLRTDAGEPRWPFRVASMISGGAILAIVLAAVTAVTAGRDTWNSWVSGSQFSEAVTLWVLLIVVPVLLATCLALLIIGFVLRARHLRHDGEDVTGS